MQLFQLSGDSRYLAAIAWVIAQWCRSLKAECALVVSPVLSPALSRVVGLNNRLMWPRLVIDRDVGVETAHVLSSSALVIDGVRVLAGLDAPERHVVEACIQFMSRDMYVVTLGYEIPEGTSIQLDDIGISHAHVVMPVHRDRGVEACLSAGVGIPYRSKLARNVITFMECLDV